MNITEASKRLDVSEDYLKKLYEENRIEAQLHFKDYPEMVSVKKLADIVGLTESRINKLCLMGAIRYCWIGRYIRITKEEATEFERRYNAS